MDFFRNPEIRKSLLLYMIIAAAAIGIGFFIGKECGFWTMCLCLGYTGVHFIYTRLRYKRISGLSREIDRILHGSTVLKLDEYVEGELAILGSEVYKMTVRLREHADILKKDKQYLADSLADISHQIRTPLTSMNLIASLFQDEELPEERRTSLVQEMLKLLSRIEWLIATLLKISRLDAGTVQFKKENVPVANLLKKAIEPIAITMELMDQQIQINMGGSEAFRGDPEWSVEAVLNILKNCMEHAPAGGKIQINVSENAVFTELIIKDNGFGIDKNDLPHLFERYYRGKNAKDKSIGIGLALARMIITEQNGTIKVENGKERGAVFTIRFYKSTV